jgi:hypothetical protein
MNRSSMLSRLVCAAVVLACSQAQTNLDHHPQTASRFPFPEKLTYRIEWRMLTAGVANLEFVRNTSTQWTINLDLESSGVVNRLYRVQDKYKVSGDDRFCAANALLEAQEGKRHNRSRLTFDNSAHKLQFEEQDFVKNRNEKVEIPIVPCTHEIAGALASLGQMDLSSGKSAVVPVTNGKKLVHAKVEAQAKETVVIDGKTYQTVRYEAFLFDNVLYKRKGRLFIWLTDDPERTPVQFRIQLGFPIGTISLELEKQQRL